MSGMNKLSDKEKRKQRRALNYYNHIKADLRTPKYKQQVVEPKRIDLNTIADRFHEDEVDW